MAQDQKEVQVELNWTRAGFAPLALWSQLRRSRTASCVSHLANLGVEYEDKKAQGSSIPEFFSYTQQRRAVYDGIEQATAKSGLQVGSAATQGVTATDMFQVLDLASARTLCHPQGHTPQMWQLPHAHAASSMTTRQNKPVCRATPYVYMGTQTRPRPNVCRWLTGK